MIDNTEDLIDSRDVIERIAELEAEAVDRYADGREDLSYGEIASVDHVSYLDEEDAEELIALGNLAQEGSDASPDWEYGVALIRNSYFEDYARELAEEIGAVNADAGWPNNCIDWEQAARELRMDYTAVDFDGVTYWVR